MAEHADGSIIVDTEIDAQGFKAGSSELQRAIKSLNTKIQSLGPTFQKALTGNESAITAFETKAAALESTISELEEKLKNLGGTRVPTEQYTTLIDLADKCGYKLDALYAKQKKMEATGVKKNSQAWRSLQYEIERTGTLMEEYNAHARALEEDGVAFQMGSNTAEFAQLENDLSVAKSKLAEMQAQAEAAKQPVSKLAQMGNAVKTAFSKIGPVCKKAFSACVGAVKKGISAFKRFFRSSNNCVGAIGKLGKKLTSLGSMLKRMALRKIMMGIITSVKEGFDNLAQYSSQANADLSALKSGLTQLKNSFATAFAPILTVVTPALSKLISLLSRALTYIGKLFAALTGATTFVKAKEVQEDYAESLGNTSAAAKEAKRQLAGFDDLNVLTDSSSDSGGGGGGVTDPSDMFEEVPIESSIVDFIGKIKEAFRAGDYAGIGEIIGNGINSAFQKVNDIIKWDTVGESVTTFISGVADGFNAMVDTIDWALIGDTFAQGFNTVINTIHLVFTEFDWQGVAAGLVTGLNGFVSGVDWAALGQTISDGFVGALKFIHTALETFDWQALGKAVATLVANIDWSDLFKTVLDIIGEIFSGVMEFRNSLHDNLPPDLEAILTLVEDIAIALATWKIAKPVLDGISSILGLPSTVTVGVILAITGITLEIKGIADAIQSELDGANFAEIVGGGLLGGGGAALFGSAIATWIDTAFGSSAVSLALTEAGINLGVGTVGAAGAALSAGVAGIILGIPAMFVGIYDACKNGIDWLSGLLIPAGATAAGAGVGVICAAAGTAITPGIGTLIGLAVGLVIDGIILVIQYWDEITSFLSNFFTVTIPNMWNSFVNWITKTVPAWFSSLPGKISKWFSDLWRPIKEYDWAGLGYNIGQWFGNAVKDAIHFVTVSIPNWFSEVWNSITSALKTFFTVTLPNFFTVTIPKAFNAVVDFFKKLPETLWNAIKSGWNWLVDIGKSIIDGIWEGLQSVWQAITDFVNGFVQGFKDALGIHSPSTVFAEIGGFLVEGLLQGIKNLWGSITSFFSNALASIKNMFSNAWNSIKTGATTAWTNIKTSLSTAWTNIKTTASNTWDGLKSTISTGWDSIKTATSTKWTEIKTSLSATWEGIKTTASSKWNSLKTTVSTAWDSMKSTASTKWTEIKTNLSTTWESIKTTASTKWSSLKSTISTGWDNIKTTASTKWTEIKTNLSNTWENIKSTASTKWSNLKNTISTGWNNIKTNASSTWDGIKSTLSSKWDSIKSAASSKWDSIKSTIQNKGWSSVGSNICSGIGSGIDSGWSWLKNKVSSVASSLLDKAKSALGIHSPSRLFRDIVGLNIGYGIGEGIEASEGSVVNSVAGLADAVAAEANANEYSLGGIVSTPEVDGALTGFSDKVASSFSNLLERLQAIADGVTFTTPAVALGGSVPYSVSAHTAGPDNVAGAIEASNDELGSVVIQAVTNATTAIVAAIEANSGTVVNLDANSIATSTIKEINRRTRAMGRSPLTTT